MNLQSEVDSVKRSWGNQEKTDKLAFNVRLKTAQSVARHACPVANIHLSSNALSGINSYMFNGM